MIFRAKTQEGYIIKILIELLQQVIKTACFEVNSTGLYLCMMDSQQKILINLELKADNFNIFEIKHPIHIGLNLIHLYRMLKSIKKKDSLLLFIDAENPTQLQFIVHPPDNNRMTKSTIHIQNIQNITVTLPSPYDHPVIISSTAFQRTLRDMHNINTTIQVKLRKHSFYLSSTSDNIFSRDEQFGELNDTTDVVYEDQFEIEQFVRIMKIAGLNKTLHVYSNGYSLPLQLKTLIGNLGYISIYIKSKTQIN